MSYYKYRVTYTKTLTAGILNGLSIDGLSVKFTTLEDAEKFAANVADAQATKRKGFTASDVRVTEIEPDCVDQLAAFAASLRASK